VKWNGGIAADLIPKSSSYVFMYCIRKGDLGWTFAAARVEISRLGMRDEWRGD
jgi:hypothetical protein